MKRIQRRGYTDFSWQSNSNAVYCGRPSKYGNPFKLLCEEDRDNVLIKYELWLMNKLSLNPSFLNDLIGKDPVCYCPLNKRCHTDILIKYTLKISKV
jgi:hypothetical protein